MKNHESHARKHQEVASDDGQVTDADVEAWASRVRERRKAWLDGPNEDEKREWAERERDRRARRVERDSYEDDIEEGRRIADRWRRDVELIVTGIAGRIIEPPYELIGTLIRDGRRFEDDLYNARRRRRRVLADDDR